MFQGHIKKSAAEYPNSSEESTDSPSRVWGVFITMIKLIVGTIRMHFIIVNSWSMLEELSFPIHLFVLGSPMIVWFQKVGFPTKISPTNCIRIYATTPDLSAAPRYIELNLGQQRVITSRVEW